MPRILVVSVMAPPRTAPDYYARLGIAPDASPEDIRRAYRRLALQWHPDRNPNDPNAAARFREISEAYAVLSDPTKRRTYDAARRAGGPGPFEDRRDDLLRDLFADRHASSVFDELARELSRHGVRVNRRHFEQTLFGGRAVVTGFVIVTPGLPMNALWQLARAALRTGARGEPLHQRPGAVAATPAGSTAPPRSGLLDGLMRAGRWLLGLPAAGASHGADIVQPLRLTLAEARQGTRKRVRLATGDTSEEVMVTVPAGVRPGTRLRLRGKGHRSPGRRPGDAYLVVEIAPER